MNPAEAHTPKAPERVGPRDELIASGRPLVYRLRNLPEFGLTSQARRHGHSLRLWARSLSVMQKECIVLSPRTTDLWRLSSDEGPYLKGFDSAPCPLAFFTTGLAASLMNELQALAKRRGVDLQGLQLVLDNFYSMSGSALRGTMRAEAYPPRIRAFFDGERSPDPVILELLEKAVAASPVCALVRKPLASLFTLGLNGRLEPSARPPSLPDPGNVETGVPFERFTPAPEGEIGSGIVEKLSAVETRHGIAGGYATSLAPRQDRRLHIRGTCRLLPDGVKEIRQELFSPLGSIFRFLSDEAPGFGGQGRAPDAASYAAAGVAFCFMTQLERYAQIVKQELTECRVVQDLHLSNGGFLPGETAGDCDPVETHLQVQALAEPEFARRLLHMGEQTCFLHALCRSALDPEVESFSPAGCRAEPGP
ncbi:MAG: OsmC family protein [Xanthomonadales bacterium]|nr:OsmC family protein [Xanthomonadales bacterium]